MWVPHKIISTLLSSVFLALTLDSSDVGKCPASFFFPTGSRTGRDSLVLSVVSLFLVSIFSCRLSVLPSSFPPLPSFFPFPLPSSQQDLFIKYCSSSLGSISSEILLIFAFIIWVIIVQRYCLETSSKGSEIFMHYNLVKMLFVLVDLCLYQFIYLSNIYSVYF